MATEAAQDGEPAMDVVELCFTAIERSHDIMLINSCSEIEGKYVDYISGFLSKKEVLAVRPLIWGLDDDEEDHPEIMQWLQGKQESSCVLASFGTECCMSKEEMEEIAMGLEQSQVNFIWVVKFLAGVNTTIKEVLPRGYLEKMKENMLVIKGWVPQVKILSDKRICGFLSHCGWNSILESLSLGVPIIALPLAYNQFANARLVGETGVGVEVMKGENEEIKREELAKALRKVVMEKSREGMKSKARELSESFRLREEKVIDEAVDKLLQLYNKNLL